MCSWSKYTANAYRGLFTGCPYFFPALSMKKGSKNFKEKPYTPQRERC